MDLEDFEVLPPVDLDEEDMDELKEIIIEFLSKYEALYERRIQKLIFFAEVYTAQQTGQRLTDAKFAPYDYGPYSKAVLHALEELADEGRVYQISNGQYKTDLENGDISPKKTYLIDRIHSETKRMSSEELIDRAKDTWLWENFEYAEEMDFAEYIDEVIIPPEVRRKNDFERDPVEDPDIERLLS